MKEREKKKKKGLERVHQGTEKVPRCKESKHMIRSKNEGLPEQVIQRRLNSIKELVECVQINN